MGRVESTRRGESLGFVIHVISDIQYQRDKNAPKNPREHVPLGTDLLAAMDRLHERDGISPSEMARRALTAFLIEKGVLASPSKRKKGGAR